MWISNFHVPGALAEWREEEGANLTQAAKTGVGQRAFSHGQRVRPGIGDSSSVFLLPLDDDLGKIFYVVLCFELI